LSCNLGTLNSWNPLGHSRPVKGLLYLFNNNNNNNNIIYYMLVFVAVLL